MQTRLEDNNKLRAVLFRAVTGIFLTMNEKPRLLAGLLRVCQLDQSWSCPTDHWNFCLIPIKLRVYNVGLLCLEHHDSMLLT